MHKTLLLAIVLLEQEIAANFNISLYTWFHVLTSQLFPSQDTAVYCFFADDACGIILDVVHKPSSILA
jgi:hypothetical protein